MICHEVKNKKSFRHSWPVRTRLSNSTSRKGRVRQNANSRTLSHYFPLLFWNFSLAYHKKVVTLSAGQGKMPEWSIGPHSKCGERATVPRVRIPVFPPRQKLPVKFCPSKWGLLKSFVKFTKQNSRLRYLLQRNGKAGKIHFPSIRENCVFRRWHPCAVLTARD